MWYSYYAYNYISCKVFGVIFVMMILYDRHQAPYKNIIMEFKLLLINVCLHLISYSKAEGALTGELTIKIAIYIHEVAIVIQ